MADIPTLEDLEGELMLAEKIELLVSASVGETVTPIENFTTMSAFGLSIVSPETRFNHGTIRTYGHGAPDIGIKFTLSLTERLIEFLRKRTIRSTSNVLPIYNWAMKATSVAGNVKTITVKGKLIEREYIKNEGDQGKKVDVECFVRVIDEAVSVAT